MPLPLTVSCFSTIQISFTFLVPTHPGIPWQRAVKRVCVWLFTVRLFIVRWVKRSIAVRNKPHRYGNSRAIWNHTVLPATRQRWHSRRFIGGLITGRVYGPHISYYNLHYFHRLCDSQLPSNTGPIFDRVIQKLKGGRFGNNMILNHFTQPNLHQGSRSRGH